MTQGQLIEKIRELNKCKKELASEKSKPEEVVYLEKRIVKLRLDIISALYS